MESELLKKIEKIKAVLPVDKILNGENNSVRAIKRYYRINHFAYKKFHSDQGFMHFRISPSGKIEPSDVFYQPNVISSYIPKDAKVVELGSGQNANICYLAKKHPDSSFTGYDLKPVKLPKNAPKNIKIIRGDYGDMRDIPSGTVDLVYGIETIVHCSDKEKVFSEVYRILKPNGKFIVYDYATEKPFLKCLPYEQTAIDLISKCGASARIESDEEWENHLVKCGFKLISTTDFAKQTIPDLKRLKKIASKVIDDDKRLKFVFKFLPRALTNNIIIAYLGEDVCREDLFYYNEWIYERKEDIK